METTIGIGSDWLLWDVTKRIVQASRKKDCFVSKLDTWMMMKYFILIADGTFQVGSMALAIFTKSCRWIFEHWDNGWIMCTHLYIYELVQCGYSAVVEMVAVQCNGCNARQCTLTQVLPKSHPISRSLLLTTSCLSGTRQVVEPCTWVRSLHSVTDMYNV